MQLTSILLLASAAIATPIAKRHPGGQGPFRFPLTNGFPVVKDADIRDIEKQAHGTLPPGPFPKEIGPDTAAVFSLIAFNEIFEVAYFTSLIHNITTRVPGYETNDHRLISSLVAIQAQEELHAIGANAILASAGKPTIGACEYVFPVDNLKDALKLANTFTDLVLGTLQTALTTFGKDKDLGFLQLIGSVIGQEGEQNGFFRSSFHKIASSQPFLTVGGGVFANSALTQDFVVPGTCDKTLPIPVLKPLSVSPPPGKHTSVVSFTFPGDSWTGLSLAYINGQNTPLVYPITPASKPTVSEGKVTFEAIFPYDDNLLSGLTIAAIVSGNPTTADEVGAKAIAGPALIEVN